ncbi:MAG TPA: sigma-70 family RNA polymerase sigma factor [Thermoanaerobaculia bacterium]|nr:sigma-70 family RNA polymerase sigma factor [Thermoanaerobaculia bacterium]
MPPSDGRAARVEAILKELQAGAPPEDCFQRLFEIYYDLLRRFFSRRGFAPEDCQELTQDTFLGIYTGIGSFRGESGFETWMWKIANNTLRKRWRWLKAEKRAAEEVPLDEMEELIEGPQAGLAQETAPDPGQAALDRERSRLMREAIERLPDQMCKCLMLRVYRDLKYREIAVVLRLSVETVKAHLFAARKRLQQELGDYFQTEEEP